MERTSASFMRWGTLGILAFWLAVMAGLYVVMERVRAPRAAVVAADGVLLIARGSDGHFRVAGSINGQPVQFMVDTGASVIAVTDALAQRAGLEGGEATQFRTANGLRPGRVVVAQSVTVGPLRVSSLRVGTGYTGETVGDALLGQIFLQHFDVQMQRDRMVLRPHP